VFSYNQNNYNKDEKGMSDIYQTPKASLENEANAADNFGSIEQGLRGDYRFHISEVLSEAWEKTSGAKGTIILAIIIYLAVSIGLSIVQQIILAIVASVSANNEAVVVVLSFVLQILFNFILLPIGVGLTILGIRRSADASIEAGSIMGYFSQAGRLFVTYLIMMLMVLVGFLLLIIPGIYLSVAYYFAIPLVAEKGLAPWEAMEISRKVVSKKWFTMFFFSLVLSLILALSALPLLIGLIWTIPMAIISYGIIYRNMFGIRDETLREP
jgi:uncharacterized membrane protein